MGKPVLQTIDEYKTDPEARERLATAEFELELCDRMVSMREQAGLTQQQLAERLGCTQAYIAKLENGAFDRCGIGTLRRVARALGHDVNIDALFTPNAPPGRAHLFG